MVITASSWLAILVTFDRVAALKNWKLLINCIRRHPKLIIVTIVISSAIFHVPRFVEYVPSQNVIVKMGNKQVTSRAMLSKIYSNYQYRIVMFILNSTFTTIIPLFLISVLGGILIINFILLQKSQNNLSIPRRLSQRHRVSASIATKLVCVYCSLFIITEIFSLVVSIFAMIDPTFIIDGPKNVVIHILSDVNNFFIFVRTSVSFLLYWLSCSQYRETLRKLF